MVWVFVGRQWLQAMPSGRRAVATSAMRFLRARRPFHDVSWYRCITFVLRWLQVFMVENKGKCLPTQSHASVLCVYWLCTIVCAEDSSKASNRPSNIWQESLKLNLWSYQGLETTEYLESTCISDPFVCVPSEAALFFFQCRLTDLGCNWSDNLVSPHQAQGRGHQLGMSSLSSQHVSHFLCSWCVVYVFGWQGLSCTQGGGGSHYGSHRVEWREFGSSCCIWHVLQKNTIERTTNYAPDL